MTVQSQIDPPAAVAECWQRFISSRSLAAREALLRHYWPLVLQSAQGLRPKLPPDVAIEDLASAGSVGLIRCLDAFDASRGVRFEAYCSKRVRGAMLDELRRSDWLPQAARRRARRVTAARERLSGTLGRPASGEELAEHLRMDPQQLSRAVQDADAPRGLSLDRDLLGEGSARPVDQHTLLHDPAAPCPLTRALRRELLARATDALAPADRLIVMMYYFEGLTMKETGTALGMSEGRVSQRHAAILLRLRAFLGGHDGTRLAGGHAPKPATPPAAMNYGESLMGNSTDSIC